MYVVMGSVSEVTYRLHRFGRQKLSRKVPSSWKSWPKLTSMPTAPASRPHLLRFWCCCYTRLERYLGLFEFTSQLALSTSFRPLKPRPISLRGARPLKLSFLRAKRCWGSLVTGRSPSPWQLPPYVWVRKSTSRNTGKQRWITAYPSSR